MRKIICLLLAAVMLLSLTACGGGEDKSAQSDLLREVTTMISFESSDFEGTLTEEHPMTAEALYQSIEYVPEMFYGNYVFGDSSNMTDAVTAKYIEQAGLADIDVTSLGLDMDADDTLTALPFSLVAGPENLNHVLGYIEGRNVAQLYFLKNGEYMNWLYVDYVISGNQIICTPFLHWNYNEADESITYEMADVHLVYDFAFSGSQLTLSSGGKSITMSADLHSDDEAIFGITGEGCLKIGTVGIEGLDRIDLYESNKSIRGYQNGERIDKIAANLYKDGRVTLTWSDLDEVVHTRHMVYFNCDFNGFVFADQEGTYCYTATWSEYRNGALADNLSAEEVDSLESLSDAQAEAIIQKKADLEADLAAACELADLNVVVDANTGEIALDAGVLFGVNASDITAEGQEFLKKFMDVYTSVVFDEKYSGFVSKILVEGHTDTNGDYDMNLDLSQKRADSVQAYCLSGDCGVSADLLPALTAMFETKGCSYDFPIYDANGEVDMDASRRVSFRLFISLTGA